MDTANTDQTLGGSIDRLLERLQTARQNVTEIEAELAGARDKLRGVVKRTRTAKAVKAQPAKRNKGKLGDMRGRLKAGDVPAVEG